MLKMGDQNFAPFDSGNIHIEENKTVVMLLGQIDSGGVFGQTS